MTRRSPKQAASGLAQLTLRGLDARLEQRLREVARERDLSLNRAALLLLRRGAGLVAPGPGSGGEVGGLLDRFVGLWSEEEERELRAATEPFDEVDSDFWD